MPLPLPLPIDTSVRVLAGRRKGLAGTIIESGTYQAKEGEPPIPFYWVEFAPEPVPWRKSDMPIWTYRPRAFFWGSELEII
jgi:hypothetical protein